MLVKIGEAKDASKRFGITCGSCCDSGAANSRWLRRGDIVFTQTFEVKAHSFPHFGYGFVIRRAKCHTAWKVRCPGPIASVFRPFDEHYVVSHCASLDRPAYFRMLRSIPGDKSRLG